MKFCYICAEHSFNDLIMTRKLIICAAVLAALGASAGEKARAVFNVSPAMSCANCEKRVTDAVKFVKGVTEVTASAADNTVTVVYDTESGSPELVMEALAGMGYIATPAKAAPAKRTGQPSACPASKTGQCGK